MDKPFVLHLNFRPALHKTLKAFSFLLFAGVPAYGGMIINLIPGAGLQANPDALASFQQAALSWSNLFSDPITVNINADLSNSFSSNNIIGSTSAVELTGGYSVIEGAMAAEAIGQPDKAILASLPTAAQFSANLPAGFTLSGNIDATKADLKALGFAGLDQAFGASDASIVFNSNFNFFYGSGTIQNNQIDFKSVATHEIGHALGFISAVDVVDQDLHDGVTEAISPDPLDLFRFASNNLPASTSAFTNNTRDLMTGGADDLSDTESDYGLSTGFFTGDGNQASHWKDDDLTGQFIGVMDPTIAFGATASITPADVRAMELIGYDLAAPEPGTLTLMLGTGLLAAGILRRTRHAS